MATTTASIYDAAQDELLRRLTEAPAEMSGTDLVRAYKESGHQRRLDDGEATGRIEVTDANAIITAVFAVAGRFVPADRRDEFLGELDGAVGGLVVIDGGRAAA